MFYRITCPVCGTTNRLSFVRLSQVLTCSKCKSTLSVSSSSSYWVEVLLFIPIYFLVASLVDGASVRWRGTPATYWEVFPFVVLAAVLFHGVVAPLMSSIKVTTRISND
jgi:hypothetical protein